MMAGKGFHGGRPVDLAKYGACPLWRKRIHKQHAQIATTQAVIADNDGILHSKPAGDVLVDLANEQCKWRCDCKAGTCYFATEQEANEGSRGKFCGRGAMIVKVAN